MTKKDIWSRLEVRTGKQITLWVLTASTALLFGNEMFSFVSNVTNNPTLAPFAYISLLILFRIVLGYLFD